MRFHIPFLYDFFEIGGVFSIEHTLSWPSSIPGAPYRHVTSCYLLALPISADKHQILVFSPQLSQVSNPITQLPRKYLRLSLSKTKHICIPSYRCPALPPDEDTFIYQVARTRVLCIFVDVALSLSLSHIQSYM